MRCSGAILGVLLLALISSRGDDRPLDWVKVTEKAGWHARDSSGEVVYKDRLWLLGGWFDSFSAPPRDVWSSPDGATWTLATKEAPWTASDLPMSVVFDGRMWLMGGWSNGRLPGHGASGEVYAPDEVDAIALRADLVASSVQSPASLPSATSPLQDIAAEQHARWEMRLFVS